MESNGKSKATVCEDLRNRRVRTELYARNLVNSSFSGIDVESLAAFVHFVHKDGILDLPKHEICGII